MLPIRIDDDDGYSSKSKGSVSRLKEKVIGMLRLIWSDPNSRNLAGFLLLNLSFAFVELFYGVWTNSLGLISDSFHMFFDCTGLLAGLVGTIITKWRANERYSYGYVRAEILAGFINGLFLLFISFFIFSEAIERLVEPPEVKHERLLVVSILGLLVNLVGIFVFQHGGDHGHSHGGDDGGHGHSHGGKKEEGNSLIMQGVFLHILADTLGSVGVIISAILIQLFGWMIADPVCSIFIAVLIGLSVGSLVADSASILMQRSPKQLDSQLQNCYREVMQLEGVQGVQEPHFWTLCTNNYCGGLKLEVLPNADHKYIISQTQMIFRDANVTQLYVQLDGDGGSGHHASNPLLQLADYGGVQNGGYGGVQMGGHDHGGHGHGGQDYGGHGQGVQDHGGHGHSHDQGGHGHGHSH